MNADRLLDGLDRLGDEPETVQQFRKLVVGLAMSGRLVTPDEAPRTPSDLSIQIEARIRLLVQQGVLRKQSPLSDVFLEDLPTGFTNPSDFVRLGEIARIEKGQTGIMKAEPGAYPLVVTAEERGTCDHFDFDSAAAIVPLVSSAGHGKASLQRLHYQEGKFALGSILAAIFPYTPELISARFLFEYLTSFKDELLVSQMIGTANVSLSVGKIANVPVPLVPPAVQRKVDELMELCDRLEVARAAREAVRDRLAAASFARLNAPDPKTFQEDVRFALDALPALTKRPDQVKALRQTIINLAVRGKLVPQDAKDEPASLNAADCDERPEAIPSAWLYTRLSNLLAEDTRNGYSRKPDEAPNGIPILRISAGTVRRDGVVAEEEHKLISGIDHESRVQYGLRSGDLLACRFNGNKGFVGRLTIFKDYLGVQPIYPDKLIRVRVSPKLATPEFLRLAGDTDLVRAEVEAACATTVGNWGISASNLKEIRFPLPPLAEQHRIVAKVDTLMALCDQLEASLTVTAATRRRLLDALLAEALAPAEDSELEAAE